MGFNNGFLYNQPAEVQPVKAKTAAAARKQVQAGERGCDACPLHVTWGRISTAKMPICGARTSGDILLLGDAPTLDEDRYGEAFSGRNGKLIRKVIPGRDQDRIVYQHLVRCATGDDDAGNAKLPTLQEVHCCGTHLEADVDRLPIKAILGIGVAVLSRFFPGAQMRRVHGTRMPIKLGEKTVWFYPVFDAGFLRQDAGFRKPPEDSAAWPVFKADVKNFFKEVDRWPAPSIDTDLVPTDIMLPSCEADAREILAAMEGVIAIDIETNNLRPYNTGARLLMASASDGVLSMTWAIDHPDEANDWGLPLLVELASTRAWVAHQLQFEYSWIKFFAKKHGLPFAPAQMHDSMACARIYHNRHSILGLDDLSQVHLGVNIKWVMNIQPARILEYPITEAKQYCGLDTLACARIFAKLHKKVDQSNYERLIEGSIAVADMALMGLDPDFDAATELHAIWSAKVQEFEERAKTLYEVRTYERERGKPFQISAPIDVGVALVEYGKLKLPGTKKGQQFQTSDDVLAEAAPDGHPLIDAVLGYRGAAKMVSTYIEPTLAAAQGTYDSRLHPSYTIMHTATYRTSSEDPNIQNWPSRNAEQKQLRRQVKFPAGHVGVKFDYKALEVGVEAMASKDAALCDIIISGRDMHAIWRDKTLDVHPPYIDKLAQMSGQTDEAKILKAGRDIIKSHFVFASFFGSTADGCSKRSGVPLRQMQELTEDLWHTFPGVKRWINEKRQEYKETGSARLLTGQVRHEVMQGNEPINTPIQGTGAIIVVTAMNALAALARERDDPYLHPRINIHDDLTFILPDDERLAGYIDTIVPELIKVRFDWQIVPLGVEAAIGTSWDAMEEFAKFTGDYVR